MGTEKKNFYDVIAQAHHQIMKEKGFWDKGTTLSERMMLVITEISEAAEEVRSGKPDVYYIDHKGQMKIPTEISLGDFRAPFGTEAKLCKPEGVIVELCDVALRLFDIMADHGVSPDSIVATPSDDMVLTMLENTQYRTRPLEAYRLLSHFAAGGSLPYSAVVNTWFVLHLYLSKTDKLDLFNEVLTVKMLYNKERERMHGKLM